MRFKEDRASAFAEYTLPALFKQHGKGESVFIQFKRSELAAILDTQKLHEHHIEIVRDGAATEGIAMAAINGQFVFFNMDDIEESSLTSLASEAIAITVKFEEVYGSKKAEVMYEDETYMPDWGQSGKAGQRDSKKRI